MPLYVDGPPSHVLAFLMDMENFCKERCLSLKIYVISNNGFIEGKQNAPLFYVMKNFCARSGSHWCGGIGIGGGVMFNALRIVFLVEMGIFLLSVFVSGAFYGNWLPLGSLRHLMITLLIIAFFHLGVFFICRKWAGKSARGILLRKNTHASFFRRFCLFSLPTSILFSCHYWGAASFEVG